MKVSYKVCYVALRVPWDRLGFKGGKVDLDFRVPRLLLRSYLLRRMLTRLKVSSIMANQRQSVAFDCVSLRVLIVHW